MAIRFVIGRAGSGKSRHCLSAVHAHLDESGSTGPRLILLVPEQASLQTERALLSHPAIGATDRAEVLSFRRLAFRVLASSGVIRGRVVSAAGRSMLLRQLMGRLRNGLKVYRDAYRRPGLVERLAAAVTELMQESISREDLENAVAACGGDLLLQYKLRDLSLLYSAYLDYLAPDKADPSQHLDLACRHLDACDDLKGACIWVDGFAGFTGQQLNMLAGLARVARDVEITLLIDPEYASRAGDVEPIEAGDLFAKIQRTYLDVRRAFAEAGMDLGHPVYLASDPLPRFCESPGLAALERTVFTHVEAPADAGTDSAVTLLRAADRRAEVDYVVSLICRLVHTAGGNLRYRDIAVILRDLEPYHDLLSASLDARGIPFFMDRRRATSHHPIVELLRGLVALVDRPFSLEAVRLLLKTGLVGIEDADADELENYLLATGLDGPDAWRQTADWAPIGDRFGRDSDEVPPHVQQQMTRINRCRRDLLRCVDPWFEAAWNQSSCGLDWARLIYEVFGRFGVARQLGEWAVGAEDDGDLDLAEQHRQILRDLGALLDDLCVTFADVSLDVAELDDVLATGLSQLTLGLAPPMLDQVLVGSIERSRHPAIRVAIVVGFNEGVFPHVGSEDSILNDDDRDWLADRGVRLGTPRRQRILDESLLAYTALTRASEKLYVTYADSDEDGRALRASPYVAALQRACPTLETLHVGDGYRNREDANVWTTRDLAERLTYEFRNRPARDIDSDDDRGRWNDFYEVARQSADLQSALAPALGSLTYRNEATIKPATALQLASRPLRASVSRLETMAACPFKHFARYGLRLKDRQLAAFADVDVGTIHHAILEHFVRGVVDRREALSDLDPQRIEVMMQESAAVVAASVTALAHALTPRDRYVLRRSVQDLDRVMTAQRRIARAGQFRPRGAEVAFGRDEADSLPALELTTPKGRSVRLSGYIDRVDLAELADETLGVVIDYKRTRDKRLDLSEVYHGLSLQLLGYLLVLAERGESLAGRPVQPIGAFYVSLADQYQSVVHPDDAASVEEAALQAFGPRGVFDADRYESLDEEFPGSGRAQLYKLYRKTDGELGHVDATDAADGMTFAALLEHTRAKLGELADQVIDGDVDVKPYRLRRALPCRWCEYAAVCRYEFGPARPRNLEWCRRSAVFRLVARSS